MTGIQFNPVSFCFTRSSWAESTVVISTSLQSRFYSPAPRLAVKEEADEEFYSGPEADPLDHTADTEYASQPAPPTPTGPTVDLIPFETLRGRINYDTLKALTFKPFQLTAMSEVQKRVLKLMPYLAGGKLRGVAREEAGESEKENDVEEESEGVQRGREDLLVKARTGTGKTIVRPPSLLLLSLTCLGLPCPCD